MKEKTPHRRAGINSIRQAAKINAAFAQFLNQNDQMAEWKKYRVLLMRVDISKAPDIAWPV